MKDVMGIYKITNTESGKFYIGSSVHVQRRKQEHISRLRNNSHVNPHMQSSFNAHGEIAFAFEIIERVESKEELLKREQFWLDSTMAYDRGVGFNINKLATGGGLAGEENPMYGISPRERMDGPTYERWIKARSGENANKPMMGRRHAQESIEKMRAAATGRRHTEEWKKEHSKKLLGHSVSEKQKEKVSKTRLMSPCSLDKPVKCKETGAIYKSISDAARVFGVSKSAIFNCVTGKSRTCCKNRWEYVQS